MARDRRFGRWRWSPARRPSGRWKCRIATISSSAPASLDWSPSAFSARRAGRPSSSSVTTESGAACASRKSRRRAGARVRRRSKRSADRRASPRRFASVVLARSGAQRRGFRGLRTRRRRRVFEGNGKDGRGCALPVFAARAANSGRGRQRCRSPGSRERGTARWVRQSRFPLIGLGFQGRFRARQIGITTGMSFGNFAMSWSDRLKWAATIAGGVWVSQSESEIFRYVSALKISRNTRSVSPTFLT